MSEEREITFSVTELENFAKFRIWKQIAEDALARALMASEENDIKDPYKDAYTIAKNQGAIEALKWIVDLPAEYLTLVEHKKPKKEEKEK